MPAYDLTAIQDGIDLGLGGDQSMTDNLWSLLMGDISAPPAVTEQWNVKDE